MTETETRFDNENLPMEASAVLDFWFGPSGQDNALVVSSDRDALWWQSDASVDRYIQTRFGDIHQEARNGGLDEWCTTPNGRLALILVLDQFSRHIFRDRPEAFAQDERAQLLCLSGMERGSDKALGLLQRVFFYLPLEHAENAAMQSTCVHMFELLLEQAPERHKERFQQYLEFAHRHQRVIDRFGRFPHRNEVLGRPSNHHEQRFLRTEGRGF